MIENATQKALLLDLDGTLVDTWAAAADSFEFAYRSVYRDDNVPLENFRKLMGLPLARILSQLDLSSEMIRHFEERMLDIEAEPVAYNGVFDSLNYLVNSGVTLGVITGKNRFRASRVLRLSGIDRYIACLVTPDDCEGKPSSKCVEFALRKMSCPAENCIGFVGDTEVDILTARSSGISSSLCLWGFQSQSEKERLRQIADSVLNSPEDMKKLA
jgi:phosphoglycolate phosphatase-like HAD superfamily hydrolase